MRRLTSRGRHGSPSVPTIATCAPSSTGGPRCSTILRGDVAAALAERDAEVEILGLVRNDRRIAAARAHRSESLEQLSRGPDALEAAVAARQAAERTADGDFARMISVRVVAAKAAGNDSGTATS